MTATTKKTGATPLQTILAEVAAEAGYVQKDAKNDHHKYRYASADAVLTKVREALAKRGAAIVRTDVQLAHIEGDRRIVRVELTVAHGEETAVFSGFGEGKDPQDKGVMKANTAALKYALAAMLLMSWGDDPEASEPGEAKPAARKPTTTTTRTTGGEAAKNAMVECRAVIDAMTSENIAESKAALKASMERGAVEGEARTGLIAAFQAKAESLAAG